MTDHDDVKKKGSFGEDVFEHPSYGMIMFTRTGGSTGKVRLFGSALDNHYHTVRVTLSQGQLLRDGHQDRYTGGRKDFFEIELSAAQFAEAITTMNVYPGIPCTIRHIQGKTVESPPERITEVEHIKADFRETLRKSVKRTNHYRKEIEALLEGKLSTKARERVRIALDCMEQPLESNIPFVVERFNEATTKVVTAAKMEIDNFATRVLAARGVALPPGALTPQLDAGLPECTHQRACDDAIDRGENPCAWCEINRYANGVDGHR